jgi:hypothetical protein
MTIAILQVVLDAVHADDGRQLYAARQDGGVVDRRIPSRTRWSWCWSNTVSRRRQVVGEDDGAVQAAFDMQRSLWPVAIGCAGCD